MRVKMSDFTKSQLNRVDQDEFYGNLWVLRHSFRVREMFARLQEAEYILSVEDPCSFVEYETLSECLHDLAGEVMDHHPWTHNRFNPNRIIGVPTAYSWQRLSKALGTESKENALLGETMHKTILGWWLV